MHLRIRHISLVLGIFSTIFSFLFFVRDQKVYTTFLVVGIFLSGVSFIWILFKDAKPKKWLWFSVIVIAIMAQQVSEPLLINYSYKLLLNENVKLLSDVSQIMQSKAGAIFYLKNSA